MRLNFFFDIDGTILPVGQSIPKSSIKAMEKARRLGHRLFFCTGRSPMELTAETRALGFDGGVFSAGANVMIHDRVIFRKFATMEQKQAFIDVVNKYRLLWIIQADDRSYISKEAAFFYEELTQKLYSKKMQFEGMEVLDEFPIDKNLVKFFIMSKDGLVIDARRALDGPFYSVNNTIGLPADSSAEVMLPGLSKASGIRLLLDHLHGDMGSTVGVGDGENDLEMVEVCRLGIAMGNACQVLKDKADYVSSDIDSDGLAQAIEHALEVLG